MPRGLKTVLVLAAAVGSAPAHADEPDVQALAAAAARWQPSRAQDGAFLQQLARWTTDACARMANPLPDRERCPALLVALAFRESSWRPDAVGPRGELGLLQVHGRALGGTDRSAAVQPATNVELGARWLDTAAQRCRDAGWRAGRGFAERVLSTYAGLGCSPSRGARLVLRWGDRLHDLAHEN